MWNPDVFSGSPFAADVQSGWMYLPPMVLFTALSPTLAIRLMLVLQPVLAGFGLCCFLRSEGLPWYAATSGGVTIAVAIAGSGVGHSLPVSGSLAWTAVTLAACSRLALAATWARRIIWILLASISWGQMAAAHFSVTFLAGSFTVMVYIAAVAIRKARLGEWTLATAASVTGMLIASAICTNLAYLAPRWRYLGETELGLRYGPLEALGRRLAGLPPRPFHHGHGASLAWLFDLSRSPGMCLGGAILLGVLMVWRLHQTATVRALVVAGVVTYGLSVWVVPDALPISLDRFRVVDLYFQGPMLPAYDLPLLLASLGAFGLAAWPRAPTAPRVAVGVAAALLWVGIPVLAGTTPRALFSTAVGLALAFAILETGRRNPRVLWLLPVVLVVELSTSAHLSATQAAAAPFTPMPGNFRPADPPSKLVSPNVLLRPGPFRRLLGVSPARYVVIAGRRARSAATPHARIDRATPPFWFDDWPLTYGAHNIGGSNAIQLLRYWAFVRAAQGRNFGYHLARFWAVSRLVGNLLGVKWVVVPRTGRAPIGFTREDASGRWALYRAVGSVPIVSLLGSWHVASDSWTALQEVTSRAFDPRKTAVIEHPAGSSAPVHSSVGTASYRATGVDSAVITVNARRRVVVLLRIPYASGWHATLDHASVARFPVDYVDQGVFVPRGRHVVRVFFRDETITAALLVSALWVGALIAAATLLHLLRVGAPSARRAWR